MISNKYFLGPCLAHVSLRYHGELAICFLGKYQGNIEMKNKNLSP
jgi:hypothetical protein